jgi:hypothetical protein
MKVDYEEFEEFFKRHIVLMKAKSATPKRIGPN